MPQSFVNQALARCSVKGSKYWFNCNPEGPNHWFKVNWIDKAKEKGLIYLHFTMNDNLSLSEEVKARYRSMYVGVFFQRFILGLWVLAEGIIYHNFNKDKHTIKENEIPDKFDFYYVTSDYGITNPQVFLLCGIKYIKTKINIKKLKTITCVGIIFMIVNALVSGIAMNLFLMRMAVENNLNIKNKEKVIEQYNRIYGDPEKAEFINKYWGNKKMIMTYPNVTLTTEDGTKIYVHDLLPDIKPYIYKFEE